jgi:hypothetical protein
MKKVREYWLTQTVDNAPELAFESEEELLKNNWKKYLHVREVDAEREAAVMEMVEAMRYFCDEENYPIHDKAGHPIARALAKWEAVNK